MKSIHFNKYVSSCKFTEDSQMLYVGIFKTLFQFRVNSKFKKICKLHLSDHNIYNIFCITNTLIITSSDDNTIIKTDVFFK